MPTRDGISVEAATNAANESGEEQQGSVLELVFEAQDENLAKLDDELAAIVDRLEWLSKVIWTNERTVEQFAPFVDSKITECEAHVAAIRVRWKKEWEGQSEASASLPCVS